MGLFIDCNDLVLPKFIFQILVVLAFLKVITSFFLNSFGLPDFLEPNEIHHVMDSNENTYHHTESMRSFMIREMLPVVKFSELEAEEVAGPQSCCAVCLYGFDGCDEIRRLTNCRHVFHKECLDRWLGYDRKTCPLCRSPFIPYHFTEEAFNESFWAASGIPEIYPGSDL